MTPYAAKVLSGRAATDEEWNEHMLHTHQAAPGKSPELFAEREVLDGIDSYELLMRTISRYEAPLEAILDLGCGDGYLIGRILNRVGPRVRIYGVDMSESEIALARKRFAHHDNVHLLCERAQSLTLPSQSLDVVLCHAVLMVMRPITTALEQVARVLKEGGIFAAMTASPRQPCGLVVEFVAEIKRFFQEHFVNMSASPIWDEQITSSKGLEELFSRSRGFETVAICDDYKMHQRYEREDVWLHWRDSYLVSLLDESLRLRLRERLVEFASKRVPSSSMVEFTTPIQIVLARTGRRAAMTSNSEGARLG